MAEPQDFGASRRIPPPPPSLTSVLHPDIAVISGPLPKKEEIIRRLLGILCPANGLNDFDAILARVLERERGISTTMDSGLSLPHARVDGIGEISVALAVIPEGLPESRPDAARIRAMIVALIPNKPESATSYLKLLRAIANLFQPSLIREMTALGSAQKILDFLRAQEKARADA